jgi:hypothetical protein
MNDRWLLIRLTLTLVIIIPMLTACTPTPTVCAEGETLRRGGCDQFKRWNAKVYKNNAEHTAAGWYGLDDGDTLTTNVGGKAELNLSDCYPGAIYIFKDSGFNFQVEKCPSGGSGYCIPFGQLYVGGCSDEIEVIWSGSAKIIKTGTTFAVTYLPDNLAVTLVVVLDGAVEVQPIKERDEPQLGKPIPVREGQFVFTMPDVYLTGIDDLPPRDTHSVTELARVAFALGIEDWLRAVGAQAEEDGVRPETWPEALGGTYIGEERPPDEGPANGRVLMGGGSLDEPLVQEGMLRMVEWRETWLGAGLEVGTVTGFVAEEPVDLLRDIPYDPDEGWGYLNEAGYDPGEPVMILYPAEDDQLNAVAKLTATYLTEANVEAELSAVSGVDLFMQFATMREAGLPVMALSLE